MIEIYALKLTEQLHRPVENFLAFFFFSTTSRNFALSFLSGSEPDPLDGVAGAFRFGTKNIPKGIRYGEYTY